MDSEEIKINLNIDNQDIECWLIDGNYFSVIKHQDFNNAKIKASTLINCIGCIDCESCSDCKYCMGCTACVNLEFCHFCTSCKNCINCNGCYRCLDCRFCENCNYCENCSFIYSYSYVNECMNKPSAFITPIYSPRSYQTSFPNGQ